MMATPLNRRQFNRAGVALLAAGTLGASQAVSTVRAGKNTGKFKKAVKYQMIKSKISVLDKFKMLKELGYDGVEIRTVEKIDRYEALRARDATGLPIHGVIHSSAPDLEGAVDLSKFYGGTSVLVVAGRVDKDNPYEKVYNEQQARIAKAAPYAEKHGIDLLVENVWNNLLLSPLEMARFIDDMKSPAVGVYFDVGNVVRFGWPDHWIRTLGSRIKKLDIKEYSREKQRNEGLWKGFQVEIGEGDADYPAVRKALADINYQGWATAEVRGGDRERLKEIAKLMDKALDL